MDEKDITEQIEKEEQQDGQTAEPENRQAIEPESDREKKSKKRKRIIIDVTITLAVIGVAILLGVVLGKVILDNII